MVVLHFKKSEGNQFLYETTTAIKVDDLIVELVDVNNLRLKCDRAATALEDLASKGPLKPEGIRGLEEAGYAEYLKAEDITVSDGLKQMPPQVGTRKIEDEAHYRTGWLIAEEMTAKMLAQSMEIKTMIHKTSIDQKRFMSKALLMEQIDLCRGIMMMSYPGFHGLGKWEPIWMILENEEHFDEKTDLTDDLGYDNVTLWACNKELTKGKTFADHFGKNEKTKLVVKAVKKGGGAPAREPAVDAETHKAMLSYYHKKTEEQKTLETADDGDQHMNAQWANSGNLKASLHGQGGIQWKVGGMGGR